MATDAAVWGSIERNTGTFCPYAETVEIEAAFARGDAPTALLEGFAKTESDLLREQQQSLAEHKRCADGEGEGSPGRGGCCGSTALVVLLRADSLHLAWLGDCRAVLCRAGTAVAPALATARTA